METNNASPPGATANPGAVPAEERITFQDLTKLTTLYDGEIRGDLAGHLERRLREAVSAVQRLGKSARIGFTLTVKPGTEESSVVFDASISAAIPQPVTRSLTLYADKSGNVFADNPRQDAIPFDANRKAGGR